MIRFYVVKVNIFEPGQINKKKEERSASRCFFANTSFHIHQSRKSVVSRGILFKQNTNNSPQSFRRNHRQGVAGVGRSSGQRHRVAGSRASSHEDRQATGLSWREPHPLGVCGWAMPGAERGARVPRARARVDSITGQLSPPVNQGRPAFTACQ